ncbi:3-hydroxyacyl-[acyl-carrier-protein] dehydratase FabZ [Anoxybacter fermentans]|uniref:3-hydroxyacyl-[acyl-carrier-protein] dehydratase FabZ n=1 Tax=Anoxybacter fermentans TaxID=1323375 RepID=A0A3Q9HR98_9FIRM|nr:3-hydroxyacyl-ACP dehydratase FabZ [Anoxybacter fermentans]AZR73951.1 3-hydroxyacyl-[acyl-carrier-protein] dehydratase FabZ [Anoxybacter fermentans]
MLKIKEIMDLLPHRYPFILVDRILELEEGVRVVGIKNVTINEAFFQGHYPDHPVMPGVLIVEAMAQVSGFMLLDKHKSSRQLPYFTGIDKVKFRKPVVPGDQLRIESEMLKLRRNIAKVYCRALVDGEIVAEGELMFTVVEEAIV